jgi:hypothetical protein
MGKNFHALAKPPSPNTFHPQVERNRTANFHRWQKSAKNHDQKGTAAAAKMNPHFF